jgi:hypothetical protein
LSDRNNLLPYKEKPVQNCQKNLFLFFKFNFNLIDLKRSLLLAFGDTQKENESLLNRNLFFVNEIDTNIESLLIHDFKINSLNARSKYKRCQKIGCKICHLSSNHYYLKTKKFILPIQKNSNCDSTGIVYIIKCKKCNQFYIGESKRKASLRINEHLRKIVNFQAQLEINISKLDQMTETAVHFNSKGHVLNRDFEFYIIIKDLDDSKRYSYETDLINIFIKRQIPIWNKKINSPYSIKHLTFCQE